MSTGSSVYYDGNGSYCCSKILFYYNPLRKSKNAHPENLTMKEISTGLSVYYDGYGSYDCPKKFLPIKLLKGVKKN